MMSYNPNSFDSLMNEPSSQDLLLDDDTPSFENRNYDISELKGSSFDLFSNGFNLNKIKNIESTKQEKTSVMKGEELKNTTFNE